MAVLLFVFAGALRAQALGDVTAAAIENNALVISVGADKVVFTPCAERILKVNFRPGGIEDPDTLVAFRTSWPAASAAIIDTTRDPISIRTAGYTLLVDRTPLRFHLYSEKNQLLAEEPASGGILSNSLSLATSGGTFYGVHNASTGTRLSTDGGTIYAGSQGGAGGPFVWTTAGWGFVADADGGAFALGADSFTFMRNTSPAKRDADWYFLAGSPKQIIRALHEVTGMPPLFPKYSLGFLNTEWGIDQSELYADITTYRAKQIPIDAYILDFDWMDWGSDNYGEFRWGPKFPDGVSGAIVDTLARSGMHLMGIRKPRVHVATVQGQYAQSQGYFVDYVTDYFSRKQVGRLNFHKPEVRRWFWESFAVRSESYAKGIRGYWNDEADEYGGNLMFMQMQRAEYEGQRAMNDDRVWSMNRNFYTGAQRYAYGLWSGDIQTGFPVMAAQRLFMLSSVTLGAAWWSMDIGGFQNVPSPENYYRWIQFGAFVPIFRVHGSLNQEREPWYFGAEAEAIAAKYIRLRYALMPYIYAAAWENHQTGLPLVRPLVIEYPDDPAVANLYSEWLFGKDLLVSPVASSGATEQTVYLPEGMWIDYHTGRAFPGPASADCAVTPEDIPLFVRAGAIIPMSPDAQYTDAPAMKRTVILSSYGGGSGSALVYDDDGLTYAYERGIYHTVTIGHERTEESAVITIGAGEGSFAVPARDWMAQLNWTTAAPDSVVLDGAMLDEESPEKLRLRPVTAWAYDIESSQCLAKFPDDGKAHVIRFYFTSSASAASGGDAVIHRYALGQNYPNPFNNSARIAFSIAHAGHVSIDLYDILGRKVKTILSAQLGAGVHTTDLDASKFPSGLYFYTLRSGNFTETKKMILQK